MIGRPRACRLLTVGLAAVVASCLAVAVAVQLVARGEAGLVVAGPGTGVVLERIVFVVVVGIWKD